MTREGMKSLNASVHEVVIKALAGCFGGFIFDIGLHLLELFGLKMHRFMGLHKVLPSVLLSTVAL